jgi:hypothetical protein
MYLFQALYLLLQCGQNIEEASRRRKMQTVPPSGNVIRGMHNTYLGDHAKSSIIFQVQYM